MEFGLKYSILNGQAIYIEKSKFIIGNMWLIESPWSCNKLATS